MPASDLDELYGAPTEVSQYTKRSSNQVQIRKTFPRSAQAKSQGKAELQDKRFPSQKVFYDWQMYDAFEQMKKFVRMAKKELVIIDPYFADCVLPLIAQKRQGVSVVAVKNSRNKLLHVVDVAKFNAQYANSLTVKTSDKFHDRFLIIDKTTLIHGMRRRNASRFGGQVAQRRQRRPQGPAGRPSTTSARNALPSHPSTNPTSPTYWRSCKSALRGIVLINSHPIHCAVFRAAAASHGIQQSFLRPTSLHHAAISYILDPIY